MGNAARKARKKAGLPAPVKPEKVGTPLEQRSLNSHQVSLAAERLGETIREMARAKLAMKVS